MADGRIGIAAAPGQDGSTIDDQIAGPDQPTTDGRQHGEDEERLGSGAPALVSAFPLLERHGNARMAIALQRQATGQG